MTIETVAATIGALASGAFASKLIDVWRAPRVSIAEQQEIFRINLHKEMAGEIARLAGFVEELRVENSKLHSELVMLKTENAKQALSVERLAKCLDEAVDGRKRLEDQFLAMKELFHALTPARDAE